MNCSGEQRARWTARCDCLRLRGSSDSRSQESQLLERVDVLSRQMEEMRVQMKSRNASDDGSSKKVNDLQPMIEDFARRVHALESTVEEVRTENGRCSKMVTSLDRRISSCQELAEKTERRVDDLPAKGSANVPQEKGLGDRVARMEEAVETLSEHVAKVASPVDFNSLREQLRRLENRVEDEAVNVSELSERLQELAQRKEASKGSSDAEWKKSIERRVQSYEDGTTESLRRLREEISVLSKGAGHPVEDLRKQLVGLVHRVDQNEDVLKSLKNELLAELNELRDASVPGGLGWRW